MNAEKISAEECNGKTSALLPIRTVSEANVRSHWRARHRRSSQQRGAVALLLKPSRGLMALVRASTPAGPVNVLLTRVRTQRSRALDDDNLRGSLKAVRDGVAQVLGIDDGSDRIRFEYAQAVGSDYAVRIEVSVGKVGG